MKEQYVFLHKQDYKLLEVRENAELLVYSILAFFVPFMLGHPQELVGILVNAALVLAALNLRGIKLLPVIMLPSIGVIAAGVVFGQLNASAFILAPVIWIGNAILVFAIKKYALGQKMNRIYAYSTGIIAKVGFLFAVPFALVAAGILPAAVMGAMGMLQLYTAVVGTLLALCIQGAKKKVFA